MSSKWIFYLLLAGLIACQSDHVETYTGPLPDHPSFNFDIRPILSNNCYLCHGPDVSTREADLRLDLEEGLTARLDNGKAVIVPGSPERSEMLRRVRSHDDNQVMPPPEMKKRLTPYEVALLERWIEQGAEWEPYWAFIPPAETEPPQVQQSELVNNAIDQFVLAPLEDHSLEVAPAASHEALLRRMAFVLCGLPPEALGVSLAPDDSVESAVDQLLASPHFGERWARHWMDLMRYAEGYGHEFDFAVNGAWRYRDYLIRAFNDDLPYDEFIREAIAGDLIGEPRIHPEDHFNESLLATTHYRLGEGKHSPVDIKEEEVDHIDNIIDVTMKSFQALTVSCARCHDHKFDPIPTADYYALYGIYESTRHVLQTAHSLREEAALVADVERLRDQLKTKAGDILARSAADVLSRQITHRQEAQPAATPHVIGDFSRGDLQNWTPQGVVENTFGQPSFDPITGRLQALFPGQVTNRHIGEGRYAALRSPTFKIDFDSILVVAAGVDAQVRLVIENFQIIRNPIYGHLGQELENGTKEEKVIHVSTWKGMKAYLEIQTGNYHNLAMDFKISPNAWWSIYHAQGFDQTRPVLPEIMPGTDLEKSMQAWRDDQQSPEDLAAINLFLQEHESPVDRDIIEILDAFKPLPDSSVYVAVTEGDAVFSPIFIRGAHTQLNDSLEAHRFLEAVYADQQSFSQTGSGRQDLVAQLISRENPLTARVMVNRIWHHLFGRGLVESVDNFGLQGTPPTHPELLDFLAVKFMEDGWSIKSMIKYIVLSQTFQRSTAPTADPDQVDPLNRQLRHYPLRRLEGEAIRDALLATSGTLDLKMFGPSIPLHLTDFLKGRGRPPESGPLDGQGRRSVYQAIPRNFLPPMMLTFDMPAPFNAMGKRNVSNVPAQSLALMNDPLVIQEATRWAERLLSVKHSFPDRVQKAYQNAFSRAATEEEITLAAEFFDAQAEAQEIADPRSSVEIWINYCHSLFLMKEFIFLI